MENREVQVDNKDSLNCTKCGTSNPSNQKFCGNCGARLSQPRASQMVQTMALMLVTTSLYLVISILSNVVVQAPSLFLIGYVASALSGLYVGYEFLRGGYGRGLIIGAVVSITLGLVSSLLLFLVGLAYQGVVGPVWIFFVVMALILWRSRKDR